ncbi:beta-N-acetylhexosaminidase [Streptosporangium becharense]|uniref:beta-N-acetylhexosaminidase n=1 Tax=Streptosporangium becharense TaxID=1816182 RepID=A0A7W9MGC6_9ACTN|nr:glycoside hydrolase family 3 protein [Streptosporangium becharense]MBB2909745.1 beta-N-acetylhexosaminidase [Streptosporangium becharense]MBB5819299.1 beta-N-acetylhexosaminidase [Streptosporangium becharense]
MAVITTVVAGCAASGAAAPAASGPARKDRAADAAVTSAPAAPATPAAPSTPKPSGVEAVLASMSVEEKVGQLFMPVLYGAAAEETSGENQARFGVGTPAKMIAKYRPGGVILFPWAGNVKNVRQVVALTNGLQKASPEIPLLIAADQENGRVSRLAPLVSDLPGASVIGSTGDPSLARRAAEATGVELRALGVNLDFAPVADVNVNPRNPVIGPRAYGSDPRKVAPMVAAAVRGFHDAGIASTAKHFPGHGDTSVDSHTGLPVIKHSRAQWDRLDAPPFAAAIAENVDAIMSAHVVMPKLDPSGDPATLSKPILTGLLRKKLGFDGVVSTDALDMAGVRERYGDGEVAVRAILAGADLLLMPPDYPKAYRAVLEAVKSGRIPADRLDESVRRLLTLKDARGLLEKAPVADPAEAERVLRSEEHRKLARLINSRAR